MTDEQLLEPEETPIEFWKTYKDPLQFNYPAPQNAEYASLKDLSVRTGIDDQLWNRYYVRKLINVSFLKEAGLQELTYTETDIFDQAFTLFIEMQPSQGTVVVCKRINRQLFIFGTEDRNDGSQY